MPWFATITQFRYIRVYSWISALQPRGNWQLGTQISLNCHLNLGVQSHTSFRIEIDDRCLRLLSTLHFHVVVVQTLASQYWILGCYMIALVKYSMPLTMPPEQHLKHIWCSLNEVIRYMKFSGEPWTLVCTSSSAGILQTIAVSSKTDIRLHSLKTSHPHTCACYHSVGIPTLCIYVCQMHSLCAANKAHHWD